MEQEIVVNWGKVAILALTLWGTGVAMAKVGQERKPNTGWDIAFSTAINAALFWWAGIFNILSK